MTIERIFAKRTARIAAFIPGLHILYCLASLLMVPCRRKFAYVGMGVIAVACVALFRFFPLYGYWIAYVGWTAAVLTEYYIGDVSVKAKFRTYKEALPLIVFMTAASLLILLVISLFPKIGVVRSSGQEMLDALSAGNEENWKACLYPDHEKVDIDWTFSEYENMCDDRVKDLTSFKRYLRQEDISVSGTWELRREVGLQYSGGRFREHYLQLVFPATRDGQKYLVLAGYYWNRGKAGIVELFIQPMEW